MVGDKRGGDEQYSVSECEAPRALSRVAVADGIAEGRHAWTTIVHVRAATVKLLREQRGASHATRQTENVTAASPP